MITTASGMMRPRKSAHFRLNPVAVARRTSQRRDASNTSMATPEISKVVWLVALT